MSQEYWLDKSAIDNLFTIHNHQANILIELYKMVIPDWDNIRKLKGWPEINEYTWKYICQKFIDFDRKYHPECLAGGAWINSGFSTNDKLGLSDFEYKPIKPELIIYKGDKNRITHFTIDNVSRYYDDRMRHITVRFIRLLDTMSYYSVSKSSYRRLVRVIKQHGLKSTLLPSGFKGLFEIS